jgi:hypothetical protein
MENVYLFLHIRLTEEQTRFLVNLLSDELALENTQRAVMDPAEYRERCLTIREKLQAGLDAWEQRTKKEE